MRHSDCRVHRVFLGASMDMLMDTRDRRLQGKQAGTPDTGYPDDRADSLPRCSTTPHRATDTCDATDRRRQAAWP